MPDMYIPGMPGIRTPQIATNYIVFKQGWTSDLAGGKVIDGANASDPDNTPDVNVLRAGLLMGKITASGKYGSTIIGVTQGAYTSGGTSLTLTAAQATELVRRFGSSGTATVSVVGPPTAAGTVATTAMTWSAVNTTTGVVTITSLGVNKVAGSFIVAGDGSGLPLTLMPDGYGTIVTDTFGVNRIDVPFAQLPIAGIIIAANIINWPSDTSLQSWIVTNLNGPAAGQFVFDYVY